MSREYIDSYFDETQEIINRINRLELLKAIEILKGTRDKGGRLFILGVGGSATNASHAVNDFRKIAGIESYTPVDNVSELTARTNDDGFETVFVEWLKTSKLCPDDMLMVLSVGGGSEKTSKNLVLAMQYAKDVGADIVAVVSREGGAAREMAEVCVLIPVVSDERITPHAEGLQSVLFHLMVNAINLPVETTHSRTNQVNE